MVLQKNINYIVGLISVICICVVIDGHKSKIEGYTKMSCADLTSSLTMKYLTQPCILGMDNIMKNGIDTNNYYNTYSNAVVGPLLNNIVLHLISIDTYTIFLETNPTYFSELFDNQILQDPDFVIIYNFYNKFTFALHSVKMIIIRAKANMPYNGNKKIPICKNLTVDSNNIKNVVNANIKLIVNSMRKVLNNIDNTNPPPNGEVIQNFVYTMTANYNAIMNIKDCSEFLFDNFPKKMLKNTVFPFFDLINKYVSNFMTLLAKHINIPLDKKLKDGQIRIKPEEVKPPTNEGGSTVSADSALVSPTGTSFNINALFTGAGATYA